MAALGPGAITQLLLELSGGDPEALNKLTSLVYPELRTLAARALRRERRGHTLDTTDLVHEAYLRLVDQRKVQWQQRGHFFVVAAQMMRRILVDHARKRRAAKRGGTLGKVAFEDPVDLQLNRRLQSGRPSADLTALDEALSRLAEFDPQSGRIVELRFFGGLTIEETAEVLEISPATVKREWTMAKTWLHREISR